VSLLRQTAQQLTTGPDATGGRTILKKGPSRKPAAVPMVGPTRLANHPLRTGLWFTSAAAAAAADRPVIDHAPHHPLTLSQ
jgi:hypothetical protein